MDAVAVRQKMAKPLPYLDTRLFPEQRNTASDLDVGRNLRVQKDDLFRLDKVGHVAVIVNASYVEAGAGSLA